jgi:CDP-diacylglycerol--glycerol-3-phosphate 3-phosphatidyltransferase
MNLPTTLTLFRIFLSPLFFVSFFFPLWTGAGAFPASVILWFVFLVIEISDMVDGTLARALDQVTDTGKLLDPFADVIARLTYFVCFVATGIMPGWAFIPIMYRELGVTYLRMIMYKDGFALAANRGGKLKAVFYAISGGFGLLVHTCRNLSLFPEYQDTLLFAGKIVFAFAALLSLLSFLDYFLVFLRHRKNTMRKNS